MDDRQGFTIDFGGANSKTLPINLLQMSVFPVVLMTGTTVRSIGTCFAINNQGMCLTAKHVLEEVPLIGGGPTGNELVVDGSLGVIYLSPDPPEDGSADLFGGFIPLAKAYYVDGTDVAAMHLNLPANVETGHPILFPAQRLALDFPAEGDLIVALGYENGEWSLEDNSRTLSHTFSATTGFAGRSYPQGRDRVMMPGACFQTSVPFRSGMSGGPVIRSDGRVIGVVSTGYELGSGETPISYASPIATGMGIPLTAKDGTGHEAMRFIWEFVVGGTVDTDIGSALVTRDQNHLTVEVGGGRYDFELSN